MPNQAMPTGPASTYTHDHPPVENVNDLHAERSSLGARLSDRITAAVGSWPFIIVQSVLLLIWMATNTYLAVMIHTHPGFLKAWDPYPFILLNLVLSFQAAYTGPVVMMSQNRQSQKDRLMAEQDFRVNQKAEEELRVLMEQLAHNEALFRELLVRLSAQIPGETDEGHAEPAPN
jgi:uncharacterized membrane protein